MIDYKCGTRPTFENEPGTIFKDRIHSMKRYFRAISVQKMTETFDMCWSSHFGFYMGKKASHSLHCPLQEIIKVERISDI